MILRIKHSCLLLLCICLHIAAYNPTKITVLTKSIGGSADHGHKGALRSLVKGLERIGATFNLNPESIDEVGDLVHIMAGEPFVLDQILALKEQGKIQKIIVGPNMGVFCTADSPYVRNPNIDAIISLSDWVVNGFMDAYPDVDRSKVKQWFSGVDEYFWSPLKCQKGRRVLVYNKWQSKLADAVEEELRSYGWDPIRVSYGFYTINQFKELLQQVCFAVFLSYSESQGIALAESWAMNVPTFVWNLQGPVDYLGIHYPITSSCPFLTPATGMEWANMQEFKVALEHIDEFLPQFAPRAWVLNHMTDEISARGLLAIIASL